MLNKQAKSIVRFLINSFYNFCYRIRGKYFGHVNSRLTYRCLEIGPGNERIRGFETLNIVGGSDVDYIADASKRLPFPENTFDIIYTSHILEHVPWFLTQNALSEWVRVLKVGGTLEVWVPDGLKICKAFIDAEYGVSQDYKLDGWLCMNPENDPCLWASGRIFTYGDGTGNPSHPNWHRAIFSERLLSLQMERAGLIEIEKLSSDKVRGHDHGWINLGLKGLKP